MSHTVKIENTQIGEMELVTVGQIDADSEPVLALYRSLIAFAEIAGMSEISLIADGGDPDLFIYRAEPKVGSVLNATWLFDAPQDRDPVITATIMGWNLSVMENGASVRNKLILIRALVDLESFNVVFP